MHVVGDAAPARAFDGNVELAGAVVLAAGLVAGDGVQPLLHGATGVGMLDGHMPAGPQAAEELRRGALHAQGVDHDAARLCPCRGAARQRAACLEGGAHACISSRTEDTSATLDRKSTRLNSSHLVI